MIVLRCTNQLGTVADLDVLESVDIKVDMSAIEVGDIGEIFGVSSQAFTLPATKNNQDFLGYLDELNATNNVGFINTIPCQVLNDGIEIFTGKMYVNNVTTNQKGDTLYAHIRKRDGDLYFTDKTQNLNGTSIPIIFMKNPKGRGRGAQSRFGMIDKIRGVDIT